MPDPLDLPVRIADRLRMVIDPELGENVVDLGLIYGIAVQPGGAVRVTMTTTMKGCPATTFLKDAVAICAQKIEGVQSVHVDLVYDPPWTPEMVVAAVALRF
ncbi:metal-sulfur cluster assembly factor [Rhizobium sp. PL01]|uniref:metal-sulfur cluster assembly factor n=1 Tax=Rhizobium sp. PL01 TaxID=3085631 RepID=UPI0029811AD7|nr:metal-sulfur cluster assembly factor [Rhizobium sp. PL01]MDW5317557.1 metal-sulfur cluster assembly factor [Rhizobium sp. PL01]